MNKLSTRMLIKKTLKCRKIKKYESYTQYTL